MYLHNTCLVSSIQSDFGLRPIIMNTGILMSMGEFGADSDSVQMSMNL